VIPWVLRGLRDGVVTTRWPARPDPYEARWRGPAAPRSAGVRPDAGGPPAAPPAADGLASLCPTGAISTGTDGLARVDQGRCVLCGRCVAARPDVFAWSEGAAGAVLTREGLTVPLPGGHADDLAAVRTALRAKTAALRRSVHIRHVDAGSDGADEQEIAALLNPVYDIHRLGLFFTASPRHADVLLVTGAGAHGMAEPLRRTYDGMPGPKVVIAVGADAISGGLLAGSYAAGGGVGDVVPVDVWVPGSPPPPFAILHGLLIAVGRLADGGNR
jgi:Ni,Fe-hydrogenase III small subunit/ferredoxin